jgi:proteasome accessory factor A
MQLAAVKLADPVAAVQRVSRDLDLTVPLDLADGRTMTALEIQGVCAAVVRRSLKALGSDPDSDAVLERWTSLLDRLATDRASCAREVEWIAKLRLLEGLRRRDGLGWEHPRLHAMDLQWSDVRPERGIYHRLLAKGAVERIVDEPSVARAVDHPPADTRAWFRGEVMARYGDQVSAASWDSVIFDVGGRQTLQRVPMLDPARGTEAIVGPLLDASPDAVTLLRRLSGEG